MVRIGEVIGIGAALLVGFELDLFGIEFPFHRFAGGRTARQHQDEQGSGECGPQRTTFLLRCAHVLLISNRAGSCNPATFSDFGVISGGAFLTRV